MDKKKNYTPAQKKAQYKYMENTDRIYVTTPAGKKDIIKAHAASQGESLNSFVNRAIDETIEHDCKEE